MWSVPALGLVFKCLLLSDPASAAAPAAISVRQGTFASGGKAIRVTTFAPAREGQFPAILVLHTSVGVLAGKADLERFSADLAEAGFVAVLVRYFDRTGTLFAGNDAINRLAPLWTQTVHDAVTFTAAQPDVRPGAIGLFGYSLGAFLAVSEAADDPRVKAIVEVAGGILGERLGHINHLPPILILHGRADQRVPVGTALHLEFVAKQVGAPSEVKIYENEGHRLSPPAMDDAAARALRFFRTHLSSEKAQKPRR